MVGEDDLRRHKVTTSNRRGGLTDTKNERKQEHE